MIRPARASDVPMIRAVWNRAIRETTATFTTIEKTPADIAALNAAQPILVLVGIGFATFGAFRSGPGYAGVIEHSVYIAPEAARQGHGRALLSALLSQAAGQGARIAVGGICGENTGALALHTALGFHKTAHMPGVGRKFGRDLDLVLMQKNLAAPD